MKVLIRCSKRDTHTYIYIYFSYSHIVKEDLGVGNILSLYKEQVLTEFIFT